MSTVCHTYPQPQGSTTMDSCLPKIIRGAERRPAISHTHGHLLKIDKRPRKPQPQKTHTHLTQWQSGPGLDAATGATRCCCKRRVGAVSHTGAAPGTGNSAGFSSSCWVQVSVYRGSGECTLGLTGLPSCVVWTWGWAFGQSTLGSCAVA